MKLLLVQAPLRPLNVRVLYHPLSWLRYAVDEIRQEEIRQWQGHLEKESRGHFQEISQGHIEEVSQGHLVEVSQVDLEEESQGDLEEESQGHLEEEPQGQVNVYHEETLVGDLQKLFPEGSLVRLPQKRLEQARNFLEKERPQKILADLQALKKVQYDIQPLCGYSSRFSSNHQHDNSQDREKCYFQRDYHYQMSPILDYNAAKSIGVPH
ncbi:hypothetical protein MMC19_003923 [Ptychographa xylographoides]|nr:hypothetical protein [Ptychographa xylographoides]